MQLTVPEKAEVKGDGSPARLFVAKSRMRAKFALRTAPKLYPYVFRVADLVKDLRLAHDLYGQAGADAPLTETTRELFERVAGDHGEQDIAAIAELWREPSAAQKTARR